MRTSVKAEALPGQLRRIVDAELVVKGLQLLHNQRHTLARGVGAAMNCSCRNAFGRVRCSGLTRRAPCQRCCQSSDRLLRRHTSDGRRLRSTSTAGTSATTAPYRPRISCCYSRTPKVEVSVSNSERKRLFLPVVRML